MIEEKGIYSIEKFLVSRRLMYWQVYLHKTVLGAEMMLVNIIRRAKWLIKNGETVNAATTDLDFFLRHYNEQVKFSYDINDFNAQLPFFCRLDDNDVMATIKNWRYHSDKVLSLLCNFLIDRELYKVKLQAAPVDEDFVMEQKNKAKKSLKLSDEELSYYVFTVVTSNTTYDPSDEHINILFKDGTVKDISKVDNALIQQSLSSTVKKYYICYLRWH